MVDSTAALLVIHRFGHLNLRNWDTPCEQKIEQMGLKIITFHIGPSDLGYGLLMGLDLGNSQTGGKVNNEAFCCN